MSPTLRYKVGQLFMVGFNAAEVNEPITRLIQQQNIGGIILFRRNVQTPEQVAELCRDLQEINAQVSDLPLLIALDQEGGMVMRIEQGVTPIPSAMAFQAAGSVDDCEQLNRISGEEMRQLGINMMLAPVLDVNNNRQNPVIGVRAYGDNTDTVIKYGMAALRGLQSAGVITTAKHFPGHGDTSSDSHFTMPVVTHDRARLNRVELPPFRAAILQGVHAIMTSHVAFPAIEKELGVPATLSRAVLTDLLRAELGFNGVIISDCLEMAAIADGVGVSQGAIATLKAGADIVLISHHETRQQEAINAVVNAVGSSLPIDYIDASFQRIQQLKQMKTVTQWRSLARSPASLMQPESLALAKKVHKAALRVEGNFRPLNLKLPVRLITVEMIVRTEVDESVTVNSDRRGSMLPSLQKAGCNVTEFVLFTNAKPVDIAAAIAFASEAQQIVVQTYNAILEKSQQTLLAALPPDKLWLVAGRLPYDLDLAPEAQGRLANYGCRPAALLPVAEKLLGI